MRCCVQFYAELQRIGTLQVSNGPETLVKPVMRFCQLATTVDETQGRPSQAHVAVALAAASGVTASEVSAAAAAAAALAQCAGANPVLALQSIMPAMPTPGAPLLCPPAGSAAGMPLPPAVPAALQATAEAAVKARGGLGASTAVLSQLLLPDVFCISQQAIQRATVGAYLLARVAQSMLRASSAFQRQQQQQDGLGLHMSGVFTPPPGTPDVFFGLLGDLSQLFPPALARAAQCPLFKTLCFMLSSAATAAPLVQQVRTWNGEVGGLECRGGYGCADGVGCGCGVCSTTV